jgi:hypothetical protein
MLFIYIYLENNNNKRREEILNEKQELILPNIRQSNMKGFDYEGRSNKMIKLRSKLNNTASPRTQVNNMTTDLLCKNNPRKKIKKLKNPINQEFKRDRFRKKRKTGSNNSKRNSDSPLLKNG